MSSFLSEEFEEDNNENKFEIPTTPPPPPSNPVTKWLVVGGPFGEEHATKLISVYAAACSFLSYFAVYGFRKPWTAVTWEDQPTLFGFTDPKLFLDWSQILGYVLGKFIGIFVVPTIRNEHRFYILLSLPLLSLTVWMLLGFFHDVGPWMVFLCFFYSGMPLSIAWSLLYRFLEGRNNPDFLGAVLSASIIMGSSVAKTIGGSILDLGVGAYWVPFATGCCYIGPFILLAFLTRAIPEPSVEEREKMAERRPMTQEEKMNFFSRHWIGLIAFTAPYILTTSARDFRDTFTVDIFKSFGENEDDFSTLIFLIDVPVGFIVCGFLICLTFIEDNARNIFSQHLVMGTGYVLVLFFQTAFTFEWISDKIWYAGCGVGIYMAYTPVASMFYDRLGGALPKNEEIGTATFMIQVSDFCGYVGTITLYSLQGFGVMGGGEEVSDGGTLDYYAVLSSFLLITGAMGVIGMICSFIYWLYRLRLQPNQHKPESLIL